MTDTELRGLDLSRRLDSLWTGLVDAPRTLEALAGAGVHDVGDLLRRPTAELLALPGIGERKLARLVDAARHQALLPAAETDPISSWLPDSLLDLPFDSLDLPRAVLHALEDRQVRSLRELDACETRTTLRPHREAVRVALARRLAGPGENPAPTTFLAELRRFRTGLDPADAALFDRLLGVGHRPTNSTAAVSALHLPLDEVRMREERLRASLRSNCGAVLDKLGRDAESALIVRDGVVGIDELVVGTGLHTASQSCTDPTLPLRWLAFARAERWCFEADRLCCLTTDDFRLVVRTTQRELRRAVRPPVLVAALVSAARQAVHA